MKLLAFAVLLPVLAAGPALAVDVDAGASVFKRCGACHAVGEGAKHKMGPELNAVLGRVAGSLPDYNYSQAMKEAGAGGLVWTPETLDPFLRAPKQHVPGTKMSFPGLKNDADVENVIAYLATFSPDYVPAAAATPAAPAAN